MGTYIKPIVLLLCVAALQGCRSTMPKSYKDYIVQADTIAGKGDFKNAIPVYTQAILLNPDSAQEAYKLRALCRYNLQSYDSSLLDVSQAIALNAKDVQSHLLRARLYEVSGKLREAIDDYTAVLNIYPGDTLALNNRGSVYSRMNEPGMALGDLNNVIKADSSYWPAYNNRALVYERLGRHDLALADCSKVIALHPEGKDGYYNRGVSYLGIKNYNAALADLNKANSISPADPMVLTNRGTAYYRAGKKDEAHADWLAAAKLGSKDAQQYLDTNFK